MLAEPTWLFTRAIDGQAIAITNPTYEQIEALRNRGFELSWDSAPTKLRAYQYAIEHLNCFPEALKCSGCDFCTTMLTKCVGQRYHGYYQRWVVFNGWLCESCIAETDSFRIKSMGEVKSIESLYGEL